MKQVKVSCEPALREILEKSAQKAEISLSEDIRRRLWFSIYCGADTGTMNMEQIYESLRYEQAWLEQVNGRR